MRTRPWPRRMPARSRAPAKSDAVFSRNTPKRVPGSCQLKWFGRQHACETRRATMRCHREDVALRMRLPSDSKSPRPVSRRGLQNSCDVELMPVICPTCQIL